ncbi:MAG: twin-arginine translocase subunit TatC [Limisphaerales bacterium]
MADEADQEDNTLEEDASSETGTGNSASAVPDSERPAADESKPKTEDVETEEEVDNGDATDPAKTAADDAEQLAFPGMPESPPEDPHHDDHEGYHDEYQDDHYYDEYHHDEHHHEEHHNDDHYPGFHNDTQHDAYRSGNYVPLDQRNVAGAEPDSGWEQDLDDEGNPYGGPVKPFLDHLEDLRWTILKCVFALLISMLGCMMGAKYLVSILIFPLAEAKELGYKLHGSKDIPVMLGPRTVGRIDKTVLTNVGMDPNAPIFDNSKARFTFEPVPMGTNYVLALKPFIPEETKGIATSFEDVMVELKNYGPFQSIWLCLQLALYGGLVIGAPFIIFFVAEFVLPALKVNEKKFLYKAAGIGGVLFMLGVAFCYFLIVQVALRASVEFSNWLGFGADEWNASEYLGFVIKFLLVMGLAFEMPVVLLTIVKIGLLDYKKLSEMRSYFVVGMLVAAAVITPSGDPFTMTLVAIPLWILYEICVIIARFWYKKDQALETAEAAESTAPVVDAAPVESTESSAKPIESTGEAKPAVEASKDDAKPASDESSEKSDSSDDQSDQ